MAPQDSINNSQYNPPEYYHIAADRSGIVNETMQSLTGINYASFCEWYYECCSSFYSRKPASHIFNKIYNLSNDDFELRLAYYEEVTERYSSYCVSIIKRRVDYYFNREVEHLRRQYEHQLYHALDKSLCLAQRIRKIANDLRWALPLFISARAGDNWLSTDGFVFDPAQSGKRPQEVAVYLANALHIQQLIGEFDEANTTSLVKVVGLAPSEDVEIQDLFDLGFTVQHCNELLKKVHIGPGFQQGPNYLKASLWALLDVLKKHELLNCDLKTAAPIIGNHYKCPMPSKPSKVRDADNYKTSYDKLEAAVKDRIQKKEYGRNYA